MVGPDEENVDRFLANRCGIGQAPHERAAPSFPAALKTPKETRCGDNLVLYHTFELLDGTKLGVFRVSDLQGSPTNLWEDEEAQSFLKEQCPQFFGSQ